MGSNAQTTSKTAAIAEVSELSPEAMELLKPDLQPKDYVTQLTEKKLYPDAVKFLAHALPKREAVWWAWMCARRASGDAPKPKIKAALEATEKWIGDPSEENRRAAMSAAEAADLATAAGCAALGAFFSGGSLGPPDAPEVPPGEFLTAKAVAGSVNTGALTGGEPKDAPELFQSFISQGLDVTKRIQLWDKK